MENVESYAAPMPANEAERVAALHRYRILDTDPESSFDELTELAAWVCRTPIALVSLIDESRQWFKSSVGITPPREVPREVSFCAHALLEPNIFVVSDAATDPRFARHPEVVGPPFVRFYAGVPLMTPDGYALGTLCVVDQRPRTITSEQKKALVTLGHQVTRELELRRHLVLLEEERARSESLLLQILPATVAKRLEAHPEEVIADDISAATVVFADIVGFTERVSRLPAGRVVELLDGWFRCIDALVIEHGLEKIKTIGDAYMAVSGVPEPRPDHVEAAAEFALDVFERVEVETEGIRLRVGLHCGPLVAGVIGSSKFSYDVWGDTVNLASRMESHGLPGHIQVSKAAYTALKHRYRFEPRGLTDIKGKGFISTYLLLGRRTP